MSYPVDRAEFPISSVEEEYGYFLEPHIRTLLKGQLSARKPYFRKRFVPAGRSAEHHESGEGSAEGADQPPSRRHRNLDSEECHTVIDCLQHACVVTANKCGKKKRIFASRKLMQPVDVEKLDKPPKCIVAHPGFQVVCLNHWVLQAAWFQYKQQYGRAAHERPEYKKSRHVAYRLLVRWCWGSLEKEIRVPLTSCTVNCIRLIFNEPGRLEDDMVFTGFLYAVAH
ncbi:hypothetical protein ACROYT_G015173 [Oculina patagonica]